MALFLVLLLSIESFGAIVSDNDGSAFITKAEFDSLKNDFQAQIDSYNTSIDNKIDGAIAAYLAGLKIESKSSLHSILHQINLNKGGKFRTMSIVDPEQTNQISFDVYYEGWTNYSVDSKPKSGWRVKLNQTGSGKVWTYAEYQGAYYPVKYYSNSYIQISGSGIIFVADNESMGYANPMGNYPEKLGTSGGNSWSYFAQNARNAFAGYTLTGVYNGANNMSVYSAPAAVSHTKHKFLKEEDKMTQTALRDGTESKSMTVTRWATSEYSGGSPGTSASWTKWKWDTREIYDDELLCYPASVSYGNKVLLWEGLPIFTTQKEGEVTFKLKKTGTGSGAIRIKAGRFNNGALPSAESCVWSETAPAGAKTYDVKFKVKKDTEYWIKCDNNINVDAEDIVLISS